VWITVKIKKMIKNNGYIPKLTFSFLEYFIFLDLKNKNFLEIGAGESTLFWEKYFKTIISYEDNENYYNFLKNQINSNKTKLKFFYNTDDFLNKQFYKEIYESDYIMIDNNPNNIDRLFFCELVTNKKNPNSCIILDNGNWNVKAYNFLCKKFLVKDFYGLNKNFEQTVTSIFYTKDSCLTFKYF